MNSYFSFVPLYNNFIERYMIKANPSFVIVYIYLLKKTINKEDIYLENISKDLNILASDIIKSLEYWQYENIISYKQIEGKVEIIFFSINEEDKSDIFKQNKIINIEKKSLSEEQVTFYSQQENIQQLFRLAEKKLAKTLSYKDRDILISLYENYGMSLELIAVLFTYCIENGKNNLNYIEKIAIDWYENNIDSVEKVENYLKIYNNDFKKIMSFFGIRNRTPDKREETFMKKWLLEYKMPLNIIEEACIRANRKTGNPSFDYANSILTNWYEKNVKSLEDIKKLDIDYENYVKTKNEEKQKNSERMFNRNNNYNHGTNKFVNYKQEPLDYELLRKIELKTLREGIEDDNF